MKKKGRKEESKGRHTPCKKRRHHSTKIKKQHYITSNLDKEEASTEEDRCKEAIKEEAEAPTEVEPEEGLWHP